MTVTNICVCYCANYKSQWVKWLLSYIVIMLMIYMHLWNEILWPMCIFMVALFYTYVSNHNYIGTRTLSKPFVICYWWDDRYKSRTESRWICTFQHIIQRILYSAVSYLWVVIMLTHVPWYRMWVPERGHLWFMPWLVAFSTSSHWLNRLWLLIIHSLCSILQCNRFKLTNYHRRNYTESSHL